MIYRNVEFPFQVSWGEVQRNIFYGLHFSSLLLSRIVRLSQEGWNGGILFQPDDRSFWINLANSDQSILAQKQYKKKNMQKEIPLQMDNSEVIDLKKTVLDKHDATPLDQLFWCPGRNVAHFGCRTRYTAGRFSCMLHEGSCTPRRGVHQKGRRKGCLWNRKLGDPPNPRVSCSFIRHFCSWNVHEMFNQTYQVFRRDPFQAHISQQPRQRTPKETQWLVDCRRQRILPLFHSNYEFAP